ncbi:MAG: fibronectin type III domain-containing protein [Clostridia bacterium]|nr:fibronectin type III domain-containing protein [Clostridia bacterium]
MKRVLSVFLAVIMVVGIFAAMPLESGALTWYEYWHGSNQPIIVENKCFEHQDYDAKFENGVLYFSRPYGAPYGKDKEAKDTTEVDLTIEFAGKEYLDGSYSHTFKKVKTPNKKNNPLRLDEIMDAQYWPSGIYVFEARDPKSQDYWEGDDNDWYRTHIWATRKMVGSFVYKSPYERLENPNHLRWEGDVAKWEAVPHATKYYLRLFTDNNNYLREIETAKTQLDLSSYYGTLSEGLYFTVVASSSGPYTKSIPSYSPPKKSYTLTFDKNGGEGSNSVSVSNISGNYVLPTGSKGFIAPYGSEFVGWSLDKKGNQMISSINMDSNKTVYAIWRNVGGKIGSNMSYNLDADTGELTIFGSGDMYQYTQGYPNQSPFYMNSSVKSVRIAAGVSSIGDYMFYGCDNLKYVYLENALDLTKLGVGAFGNCTSLERMIYPGDLSKNIAYINSNVFENCTSLKEFRIPEGVSLVGANAFKNCSSLKYVTIPKAMTSIKENVFNGCGALQDIFYPGSQEDWNKIDKSNNVGLLAYATLHPNTAWGIPVGDNALYIADAYGQTGKIIGSGATYNYDEENFSPVKALQVGEITVEDGITKIGDYLFANCTAVSKITIGKGVNEIGSYALFDCDGLTSIEIPNSVTQIKKYAFDQCDNLESVYMSPSLSNIGPYAFYNCSSLQKLYFNGTWEQYNAIYKSAYNYSLPDKIFQVSGACGTSATFSYNPESATLRVSGTGEMKNFALGESSTEPPWYNYKDEIKNVVIENGITTVGRCSFINSGIELVSIANSVTQLLGSCFMNCPYLKTAVLPDSIKGVATSTFYGATGLESIILSQNLPEISNFMFADCTSLKRVMIPESVKTIGLYAFKDCASLEQINIPDCATSVDEYAFEGASDTFTVYASCNNAFVNGIISGTNRVWEKMHNYPANSAKSVKATSTALGYRQYTCSKCSSKTKRDFTAPTGKLTLKHSGRNATAVKVSWNNVKSATGYQVQVSNKAANKWDTYATLKAGTTVYTFKNLAAGNNYKFRVRFYIKAADGKNYFSPWSATLNSPTLPKGTSVKLTTAKKAFTAKWTKVAGVTGYQVQYATNAKFSKAVTKTVKGASKYSLAVKSLKGGAKYYVRIRTYKTIGGKNYFSAWSTAKAVTTKK